MADSCSVLSHNDTHHKLLLLSNQDSMTPACFSRERGMKPHHFVPESKFPSRSVIVQLPPVYKHYCCRPPKTTHKTPVCCISVSKSHCFHLHHETFKLDLPCHTPLVCTSVRHFHCSIPFFSGKIQSSSSHCCILKGPETPPGDKHGYRRAGVWIISRLNILYTVWGRCKALHRLGTWWNFKGLTI